MAPPEEPPATAPLIPAIARRVQRIYPLAGLGPQLNAFSDMFVRGRRAGLAGARLPLLVSARAEKIIGQVADESMSVDRLRSNVEHPLGTIDTTVTDDVARWWDSLVAVWIAKLDSARLSPEQQVELARFVGDLQVKPLPPARVQLMTDLVALLDIGEFTRTSSTLVARNMMSILGSRMPQGMRRPADRSPSGRRWILHVQWHGRRGNTVKRMCHQRHPFDAIICHRIDSTPHIWGPSRHVPTSPRFQ